MAIPVARVHLAMAHAALPGVLPTPPRCMMLPPPLLPAPPCAIILPNNSPPKHSRADAVERWDANKITHGVGGPASSPSSSDGQSSLESGSPGRASTCESWVSNKIRSADAASASSSSSSCSSGSRSSTSGGGGGSRADSEERWDARKKPASPAASPASSSASSSKTKTWRISRRPNNSRAPSASAERWDAHKKQPRAAPPAEELDDGESNTGSNDVELDAPRKQQQPPPPPPRSFYAGPGFIKSPEPSMLPKPSFMIRAR